MNKNNDKKNQAQDGEHETKSETPNGEYPLQREGFLLHLQVCPQCRPNKFCEMVQHLYGNLLPNYH